jgi:hypothetical protein
MQSLTALVITPSGVVYLAALIAILSAAVGVVAVEVTVILTAIIDTATQHTKILLVWLTMHITQV